MRAHPLCLRGAWKPRWGLTAMVRVARPSGDFDPSGALSYLSSYTLTHRIGVAVVDSPSHPLLDYLRGSAVVVGVQSEGMKRFLIA